jgi:hypothetical protein
MKRRLGLWVSTSLIDHRQIENSRPRLFLIKGLVLNMSLLSKYDLILPKIPSHQEMNQAIEDLDGLPKEAATIRAKGCNLLREVDEMKVTPERLGWLNLWAKTLAVLESAISAFDYQSDLVLKMISRCTFEYWLHALAILEPTVDLYSSITSSKKITVLDSSLKRSLKEVVERLRAYTTWCLCSDMAFYKEIIRAKTLDGVWDANPAKEIMTDEQKLEMYERFFGPLEIEIDENKLGEGRQKVKKVYREKINRIERWLSDPLLKPWTDFLEKNSRVSFFSLVGTNENTVAKRLSKLGLRFGYATYISGSMVLHGSSMKEFIIIGTQGLGPKIGNDESEAERLFSSIISSCKSIFFSLAVMNHFVLNKP